MKIFWESISVFISDYLVVLGTSISCFQTKQQPWKINWIYHLVLKIQSLSRLLTHSRARYSFIWVHEQYGIVNLRYFSVFLADGKSNLGILRSKRCLENFIQVFEGRLKKRLPYCHSPGYQSIHVSFNKIKYFKSRENEAERKVSIFISQLFLTY